MLSTTWSCSNETGPALRNDGTQDNPCGEVSSSLGTKDAAELFEPASVPRFDFYLPDESWAYLKAHPVDEQYVEAQACFNGEAVGRVGLRFKGAYGSLRNCFTAEGDNTCRKLGIKVKFDEYDDERRFYGLKRLNFQGYHYDDSYLKEKLSYELYRDMGIIAPRASWAQLRVNGEEQGLFGMVEQIDGRFTSDRWPDDGDGNLYKEAWPGKGDETWIASHLQTNEETGDNSRLAAFSAAINAAAPGDLRAVLDEYMDAEQFSRYMAVDDAIANFDGIITYYTSGSPEEAGNHNFYLYQTSDGRFTLVPWDLEATLVLGYYGTVPPWQVTPDDCSQTYPVWNGASRVIAPGCNAVFQALSADLTEYRSAAQELLDGPFAIQRMNERVERYGSFIRQAASVDPHGPGVAKFEQGLGFLEQQFPQLRRRLESLVSGKQTGPLLLDVTRAQDFELADSASIYAGTSLFSNPASTSALELNDSDALAGAQSLRIRFQFGNESAAWGQWLLYAIPLASAPVDLSGMHGVRFKVRSNTSRAFRLDLDSPNNSRANDGVKMGWDLSVTTEAAELSVSFADAKTPAWAADPGDSLASVLASVTALSFKPECANRDASGQLPAGATDDGWVDLDDVEFF